MFLEDQIDDLPATQKPCTQQPSAKRVRWLVYLQLVALIPSIIFGQCERWGYAASLETGALATVFGPFLLALGCSALLFPFVALAVLKREQPRHWWSWAAVPLSILMSFTQLLAILPLVQ
jgi:hypothetical protein